MGRPKKYNTEEEKKAARKLVSKKYREKNKEKIREYNKEWSKNNKELKHQNYLKNKRELTEEEKIKKKKYMKEWREKNKEKIKKYVEDNKEKIAKASSEWAKNNPDKILAASKKWRENNKDKANKINAESRKKRKESDIVFRVSCNVRTMMSKSFSRGGYSKKSKTYKILGCSYEEFKEYIESQFEDWMTWDNYGKYNGEEEYGWDIDHITPISSAINENDVIELNHFTNLQPLCSKINRDMKKDKLDF